MRRKTVTRAIVVMTLASCLVTVAWLKLGGASSGAAPPTTAGPKEMERILEKKARADALKQRAPAKGSRLATLAAKDVQKMQIVRLTRTESGIRREYTEAPLTQAAIMAVLAHCKDARQGWPAGDFPPPTTHTLVVELTSGESFEIEYADDLDAPFSDITSRELMELLHCLVSHSLVTVIHFDAGKVLETLNLQVPVFGTQQGSDEYESSMDLDKAGRLVCRLRLFGDNRRVVMDDAKPVRYGEASVFDHKGKGYRLVLLNLP